ncbi:hypothetical protein HA402_001522 [Bradysia odoriphaga]|nr:hypothetical protein HA402_001522 [Bradysia odoriphaga]
MKCFTVVLVLALLAISNGALVVPIIVPDVGQITVGGAAILEIELVPELTPIAYAAADGAVTFDIGNSTDNGASSYEIVVPGLFKLEIGETGEPVAQVEILPDVD